MPTYRNITINLVSQFDILNIPEYAPPTTHSDPFAENPALIDKSLVSCYIPIYPLSRFWFAYSISAPHPPKALYYFKLFMNGACVVSWGCGEENGFKGKTMYALFDSGELWMGEPTVDAMGFGFRSETMDPNSLNGMLGHAMEVRVYRARGRRRIKPDLEDARAVVGKQSQASKTSGSRPGTQAVKGGVCDTTPTRCSIRLTSLSQRFAAQLESLGITSALEDPPDSNPKQRSRQGTDDEATKASPRPRPLPLTLKSKHGGFGSPSSTSDISPLTTRGLPLPAIPFIDLPRPASPSEALLQRTRSPNFISGSRTASTPGRFAQLIRRSSSRSPSPIKADEIKRPESALSVRRTQGVGVLLGAVQSALRRHGKSSSESLRQMASEVYREKEIPTREGAKNPLGNDSDDT
ncbi:MAG: hypothetical protein Q9228_007243 [Teloschistes exilis]